MASYSVADARNRLPSLIDKALDGEAVVITRHGRPVVELRPAAQSGPPASSATYAWLQRRRDQRKALAITSVELLSELYESDD